MTKEEFELLFDAEVAGPLGRRGFKRGGRSLSATENLASISLIRLGGRMARPGAITQVSSVILVQLLPWAGALTAAVVKEQLLAFGENAWCERMWIEDCKNHDA